MWSCCEMCFVNSINLMNADFSFCKFLLYINTRCLFKFGGFFCVDVKCSFTHSHESWWKINRDNCLKTTCLWNICLQINATVSRECHSSRKNLWWNMANSLGNKYSFAFLNVNKLSTTVAPAVNVRSFQIWIMKH